MKESIVLYDVWTADEGQPDPKKRWSKIGIAFLNRDDSINVVLDEGARPYGGRLHIRKRSAGKPAEGGSR